MKTLSGKCGIFLLLITGLLAGCPKAPSPINSYNPGSTLSDRGVIMPAGITNVRVLDQHWSNEMARTFYNLPQGSRFLNYTWFLNLEQASSTNLFLAPSNILALGYLPRKADNDNPGGLPVGFAHDESYVGLTCAACHTGWITHGNTGYLIDGGPTLGDGEMFMRGIELALKATLNDPSKFDRFATRVTGSPLTQQTRDTLRTNLIAAISARSGYNARNLPRSNQPRFGPGRIDAFGGILNEVAVRFAAFPGNPTQVDAPVSYPCLWDTPQHDRVQWNGIASNDKCEVAAWIKAIGTDEYGALGRNVGEVIGVFADVDTTPDPGFLRGYKSSANKTNLVALETMLSKLWSPQWPPEFGAIDPTLKEKGRALYEKNCLPCHDDKFNRTDENRKVIAMMRDVHTDPTMANNVANRTGNTGILRDRYILKLIPQQLGESNHLADMLEHIGQRAVLGDHLEDTNLEAPSIYSVQALIHLDGADLSGSFSQLEFSNHKLLKARAARTSVKLKENGREAIALNKPADLGLASPSIVRQFSPTPATSDERVLVSWRKYTSIITNQIALANLERTRTNLMNRVTIMSYSNPTATQNDAAEQARQLTNLDLERGRLMTNLAVLATNQVDSTNESPWFLDFSGRPVADTDVTYFYKARPLNGIWATAPYLHNGSVPNLDELLKESDPRAGEPRVSRFYVGSHEFDPVHVGFQTNTGDYLFDTTAKFGNSNAGHDHGSGTYQKIFTPEERSQLIEYLKSL
jgi:hypothetical protein